LGGAIRWYCTVWPTMSQL